LAETAELVSAPAKPLDWSNCPRAIVPNPIPHCSKNQRRVANLQQAEACSRKKAMLGKCGRVQEPPSLVIVSSRFKNTRAAAVHAAASAGVTPPGSSGGLFGSSATKSQGAAPALSNRRR